MPWYSYAVIALISFVLVLWAKRIFAAQWVYSARLTAVVLGIYALGRVLDVWWAITWGTVIMPSALLLLVLLVKQTRE
ncbi:MAG: hypothetical protein Q4A44_04995 [Bacteroidales bacterium]|nr:hypothetical protein [Bacteroidales bacterium]